MTGGEVYEKNCNGSFAYMHDGFQCGLCEGTRKEPEPVPASTLEQEFSESHQKFEERRSLAHTGFVVCGIIVVAGVLFKLVAIITAAITGTKHGNQLKREKEQRERKALQDTQTNYQREQQRYREYMTERRERERKKGDKDMALGKQSIHRLVSAVFF